MTTWQAIILAIVEGLTEYLPVSSTGHIILSSALMGIHEEAFTKDYTIIVQFGAILSVLVIYWRRLLEGVDIYKKVIIGFMPAVVLGLLVKDYIDLWLESVQVVAWALILGGIILLFADRLWDRPKGHTVKSMGWIHALKIGFFQCLAFIPGVSRSGASIVGGMYLGLNRKEAAEFSFFLAVPTLTGATFLKVLKMGALTQEELKLIVLGNLISFVVGLLAIKSFVNFLARRGFFVFGVYRIVLGLSILILLWSGFDLKVV